MSMSMLLLNSQVFSGNILICSFVKSQCLWIKPSFLLDMSTLLLLRGPLSQLSRLQVVLSSQQLCPALLVVTLGTCDRVSTHEYPTFCWWNRQLLHGKKLRVYWKNTFFLAKSHKKCRYNHHVPGLWVDSQLAFVHDSRLTAKKLP